MTEPKQEKSGHAITRIADAAMAVALAMTLLLAPSLAERGMATAPAITAAVDNR